MPIDEAEFLKATTVFEKKWKDKNSIRTGRDMPKVIRISTGSYELDFATGGGVPIRRWSRFWGGESSAKSLCAWNVIRNAQNYHIEEPERLKELIEVAKDKGDKDLAKQLKERSDRIEKTWPNGMSIMYHNVEQTFDPVFVENAGVDINKLKISEATILEQVGEALETYLSTGIDVHCIDSCSSAITLSELNMDVTEYRRGVSAQRWALMMKRAKKRFKDNNTGIIIDQVRINQQTGSEEAPGGKYLKHASDLSIHFKRTKWLHYDKNGVLRDKDETINTMTGMKEADGIEISTRVDKSRVGRPLRTARMRIDFDGMDIDLSYELKEAAVWFGTVERAGAWYQLPDGGEKVQGESGLRDAIDKDPELQKLILDTWKEAETA